jgi:hypothetical protein
MRLPGQVNHGQHGWCRTGPPAAQPVIPARQAGLALALIGSASFVVGRGGICGNRDGRLTARAGWKAGSAVELIGYGGNQFDFPADQPMTAVPGQSDVARHESE